MPARRDSPGPRASPDAPVVRALLAWFARAGRDLPWRQAGPAGRDPYRVLVSEVMLQQTQVSRVLLKFPEFLSRFPDLASLARAREHDVLAAWTGLGYSRRARALHRAARAIVEAHGGLVPADPAALRALPGIGRYTAGAIASLAFNVPEPLVDGNVSRVLLRLHGKDLASDDPRAVAWAWARAGDLVKAADRRPGELNESLMELGATVCTPRSPRCGACPVARLCVARARGVQESIPRPKARARQRRAWHVVLRLRDARGRFWLERRAGSGLWAGLWQCPTVESDRAPRSAATLARTRARGLGAAAPALWRARERFDFKTTACRVTFVVFDARVQTVRGPGRWCTPEASRRLPISSPMRRVLGPT